MRKLGGVQDLYETFDSIPSMMSEINRNAGSCKLKLTFKFTTKFVKRYVIFWIHIFEQALVIQINGLPLLLKLRHLHEQN
jgi:hypothetical protein